MPVLSVTPHALNVFAVTFAAPVLAQWPVLGYSISYDYSSSMSAAVIDPAAGSSVVLNNLTGVASAVLTVPFPTAPLAALFVQVRAVSAMGVSPPHLHAVYRPPYARRRPS